MILKEDETFCRIIRLLFNGIYLNKFQTLNQMEEEQTKRIAMKCRNVNIKLDLRLIKQSKEKKKEKKSAHALLVMMM